MNWGDNFGLVEIDWNRPNPLISLRIGEDADNITNQRKIYLSMLQPGVIK